MLPLGEFMSKDPQETLSKANPHQHDLLAYQVSELKSLKQGIKTSFEIHGMFKVHITK